MKSKPVKSLFALVFFAFVVSVIVNSKEQASQYYVGAPTTLVIAHRGGDGIITDRPDLLVEVLGK